MFAARYELNCTQYEYLEEMLSFQTAKLCFGYTPLQTVVSLTTTPQLSSLSLSEMLSVPSLHFCHMAVYIIFKKIKICDI
jgi:hypothetical protein